MKELVLHLLDISENSVAAQAKNICILIEEDTKNDRFKMSVTDDGKGMDKEMLNLVIDPFVTTKTKRKIGLGIPLLKAAAESCNGSFSIRSQPGAGTHIDAEFQLSHIDRMPLGNLTSTLLNLVVSYPKIYWTFIYRIDDKEFHFCDKLIKEELEGISLTEPDVLKYIKDEIQTGIDELQPL